MPRLNPIQPEQATAKELLDAVQAKLKITPNMTRVMGNSPVVLQGYLSFTGALAGGVLDAKLREHIALEVGEQNACQYCVSAHTAIGEMTGLSDAEISSARDASSSSPESTAALAFARRIVAKQGRTTEANVDAVRRAGFSDPEIAEIIAHVALNVFCQLLQQHGGNGSGFPEDSASPCGLKRWSIAYKVPAQAAVGWVGLRVLPAESHSLRQMLTLQKPDSPKASQ